MKRSAPGADDESTHHTLLEVARQIVMSVKESRAATVCFGGTS